MIVKKEHIVTDYIQYDEENLLEVLEFTGKHQNFNEWFSSDEEYSKYVKDTGGEFRLFGPFGYKGAFHGDYIVRNGDGSCSIYKQDEVEQL